jgi:hypothetical protein
VTEQYDPYETDRGSGMFTRADRELLTGQRDFEDRDNPSSALRQARYRLRERFRNTLLDFVLLAEGMGSDEIDIALQDMFEGVEAESYEDVPILRGMREAMYTFAYSTRPGIYEEMALSAFKEGALIRNYVDGVWQDLVAYPFIFHSHAPVMKVSHLKQLRDRGLLEDFCESVVDSRPPTPTIDAEKAREEQLAEMVADIEERIELHENR